jgi:predicted ferric reductase
VERHNQGGSGGRAPERAWYRERSRTREPARVDGAGWPGSRGGEHHAPREPRWADEQQRWSGDRDWPPPGRARHTEDGGSRVQTRTRELTWAGASRTEPAAESRRAGRFLLLLAFWAGLATCIVPWWLNTPNGVGQTAAVLVDAGRVTGLIAGYVLLVQVLLMSRVRWLERTAGAGYLLGWHRELGGFLVVSVLAHAVLITLGYARTEAEPFLRQGWILLTRYDDMISAFLAAGLVVGLGVLGVRGLRRVLPYEVWYYLHLSAYLILLLGYGHQFSNGQELALPGFARDYWIGLYVLVVAVAGWGRVLAPVLLNLRHRLRVLDVVAEAPGVVSIYVTGRRLAGLGARAGQYLRWRFLATGCWWQSHPFSLSAAPNGRWLRLTVKAVGDHTERLRWLRPGVRVWIGGPAGDFTAEHRTRPRALLVAAGSGIAPVRALLEELPAGSIVIYRAHSEDDLVFQNELDALAAARGARVWYVVGSRHDPGPARLLSPAGLRELVPDVARRDVYLCGPDGLVAAWLRVLRRTGVARRQIHLDPFEF